MALADLFDGFSRRPANDCFFDYTTIDGAHILKERIEKYWAERGHAVQIMLHSATFHPAIRASRYDVRSTMRNGLPVSALPSPEHDND